MLKNTTVAYSACEPTVLDAAGALSAAVEPLDDVLAVVDVVVDVLAEGTLVVRHESGSDRDFHVGSCKRVPDHEERFAAFPPAFAIQLMELNRPLFALVAGKIALRIAVPVPVSSSDRIVSRIGVCRTAQGPRIRICPWSLGFPFQYG